MLPAVAALGIHVWAVRSGIAVAALAGADLPLRTVALAANPVLETAAAITQ